MDYIRKYGSCLVNYDGKSLRCDCPSVNISLNINERDVDIVPNKDGGGKFSKKEIDTSRFATTTRITERNGDVLVIHTSGRDNKPIYIGTHDFHVEWNGDKWIPRDCYERPYDKCRYIDPTHHEKDYMCFEGFLRP